MSPHGAEYPRTQSDHKLLKGLEARAGIEPAHKGFADLSLTTWVPRLLQFKVEPSIGFCPERVLITDPPRMV